MNKNDQLFDEGIDSLGISLGVYSAKTIEGVEGLYPGKKELGLPFDHVTLFQTGKFYDSFVISVLTSDFIIDADPLKEDGNLFDDYGVDVLGLTDENLERLAKRISELLGEQLVEKISKHIQ